MAEKRMFTQKITESDAFLEMPLSSHCLYFHLNMLADDDGFVNAPKKIARIIGASDDDMKIVRPRTVSSSLLSPFTTFEKRRDNASYMEYDAWKLKMEELVFKYYIFTLTTIFVVSRVEIFLNIFYRKNVGVGFAVDRTFFEDMENPLVKLGTEVYVVI